MVLGVAERSGVGSILRPADQRRHPLVDGDAAQNHQDVPPRSQTVHVNAEFVPHDPRIATERHAFTDRIAPTERSPHGSRGRLPVTLALRASGAPTSSSFGAARVIHRSIALPLARRCERVGDQAARARLGRGTGVRQHAIGPAQRSCIRGRAAANSALSPSTQGNGRNDAPARRAHIVEKGHSARLVGRRSAVASGAPARRLWSGTPGGALS